MRPEREAFLSVDEAGIRRERIETPGGMFPEELPL